MSSFSRPYRFFQGEIATIMALSIALMAGLFALTVSSQDAPCYDTARTNVPGFYPCDRDAFISQCCPKGYACFTSGICLAARTVSMPEDLVGAVSLAACTNPQWNTAVCGDRCLNIDVPEGENRLSLVACGANQYCCGSDFARGTCNCSADGTSFFQPLHSLMVPSIESLILSFDVMTPTGMGSVSTGELRPVSTTLAPFPDKPTQPK